MPITDWPTTERPRERLLQLGAQALSDAELLAIFLRTGMKGKTAVDLARDLLNQFGCLRNLLSAPLQEVCAAKGLGMAKFALLQAGLEIGQRHLRENLSRNSALTDPEQTKDYCITQLRHRKREIFACLFLDTRHHVLAFEELFHGTIDAADVYPREVLKRVLDLNASAVIFAHNHPSGSSKPSTADKKITDKLIAALKLIDVKVLDHIVVGEGPAASFVELGLLPMFT